MKKLALSLALATITASGIVAAAPTYYADRTAFDAAIPGLTFEGFENMDSTGVDEFESPLNSTTSIAGVVSPGQIVAGIDFDLTLDHSVYVAPPGQSANPTRAMGVNWPVEAGWKVSFADAVDAFAVDVYQNFGHGLQSGNPISVTVELFGTNGALIDSSLITVPSGASGFFGVHSATGVAFLTINNATSFDVIDNIEFRAAVVPEPASYALFALGLAGVAALARRREHA